MVDFRMVPLLAITEGVGVQMQATSPDWRSNVPPFVIVTAFFTVIEFVPRLNVELLGIDRLRPSVIGPVVMENVPVVMVVVPAPSMVPPVQENEPVVCRLPLPVIWPPPNCRVGMTTFVPRLITAGLATNTVPVPAVKLVPALNV